MDTFGSTRKGAFALHFIISMLTDVCCELSPARKQSSCLLSLGLLWCLPLSLSSSCLVFLYLSLLVFIAAAPLCCLLSLSLLWVLVKDHNSQCRLIGYLNLSDAELCCWIEVRAGGGGIYEGFSDYMETFLVVLIEPRIFQQCLCAHIFSLTYMVWWFFFSLEWRLSCNSLT